jgi:hypothetical protein
MENKQLPEDFKDFIHCLNSNNVKYLLLGGWAVGIHGHPRATKDIDFFISMDDNNLKNLQKALDDFLAPKFDINHLKVKGNGIKIGVTPISIDIINDADGIDFEDCYLRREIITVENIEISVISKSDLIINKRVSGREQDLADVKKLDYKIQETMESIE